MVSLPSIFAYLQAMLIFFFNKNPFLMLYVPFLPEKMLKKIRNKGTINVLQGGGGGSAEYGQRPYFYNKNKFGPFPKL